MADAMIVSHDAQIDTQLYIVTSDPMTADISVYTSASFCVRFDASHAKGWSMEAVYYVYPDVTVALKLRTANAR